MYHGFLLFRDHGPNVSSWIRCSKYFRCLAMPADEPLSIRLQSDTGQPVRHLAGCDRDEN